MIYYIMYFGFILFWCAMAILAWDKKDKSDGIMVWMFVLVMTFLGIWEFGGW